ncbi:hypothetical protein AB5N19_03035 [Seiridium cardinale]|uniref:Uncharacterized protein n=2 Tax=Seiridium TaxID=138063 RepID=A0ABR2V5W3_9PEZI
MPEGRQSPPPERQSGAQKDEPASGKGVQEVNTDDKKGEQEDQLKNLSSNPKGALDDALDAKFTKTQK